MAGSKQTETTTASEAEHKKRAYSDFPKSTLEDALRIAYAIEDANGGRPYPPTDTAIALDISPGSSDWRTLTAASNKYGLTTGTYKTERLSLTPLAERIVSPTSDEDRSAALFEAAVAPQRFKAIFDYFKSKKLPAATFFENTLAREFDVPKEQAATCSSIFTKNAQFVGLTRTTKTGQWLGDQPSGVDVDIDLSSHDEAHEDADSEALDEDIRETGRVDVSIDRPPRLDPDPTRGKGKAGLWATARTRSRWNSCRRSSLSTACRSRSPSRRPTRVARSRRRSRV